MVSDVHRRAAGGRASRGARAGARDVERLTVDASVQHWFSRHGWLLALLIALTAPVPLAAGLSPGGYLGALAIAVALAALVAAAEEADDRRAVMGLFLAALLARFWIQLAVYLWGTAAGGPFLGPDSSSYFQRSVVLAMDGYRVAQHPALQFGTYDAAHYYFFATFVRLFGADLYGLQLLNSGLTALVGPLMFSTARRILPAYAGRIGALVSLYPSLVVLGANDLLKDPSVIFTAALACWGLVRLAHDWSATRILLVATGTAVALVYLRMARGYIVPFLELSVVCAVVVRSSLLRPIFVTRGAIACFGVVILVAEVVPAAMGWPPSPRMLLAQVEHSLNSPGMLVYATGLMDRLAQGPVLDSAAASATGEASIASASLRGQTLHELVETISAQHGRVPGAPMVAAATGLAAPAASEPATMRQRVLTTLANGFRKFFGPFPWVLPPQWGARTILTGDYLLFPGMIVWYGMLPFGMAGLALVGLTILKRQRTDAALVVLCAFVVALLLLYVALNLSYRQREFLLPFFAFPAFIAYDELWTRRAWRRMYAAYWILLAVVAVAHLTMRAAAFS